MRDLSDHERLLADVFEREGDAGLREASLGRTLALVRRRRRVRQIARGASTLALVMLVGLAVLFSRRSSSPPLDSTAPQVSYRLVQTKTLASTAIVLTKPLGSKAVFTVPGAVQVVTTSQLDRAVPNLNDDRLLELAGNTAILVRQSQHEAELVFLEAADHDASGHN
jgi:hypothetical protein